MIKMTQKYKKDYIRSESGVQGSLKGGQMYGGQCERIGNLGRCKNIKPRKL